MKEGRRTQREYSSVDISVWAIYLISHSVLPVFIFIFIVCSLSLSLLKLKSLFSFSRSPPVSVANVLVSVSVPCRCSSLPTVKNMKLLGPAVRRDNFPQDLWVRSLQESAIVDQYSEDQTCHEDQTSCSANGTVVERVEFQVQEHHVREPCLPQHRLCSRLAPHHAKTKPPIQQSLRHAV